MLRTRVAQAIQKAGDATAKEMTQAVRHQAEAAGWPTEAAGRASVRHTGGRLTTSFVGAEDLEYGTEDSAPKPVMREFEANAHQGLPDQVFATHLFNELRDML